MENTVFIGMTMEQSDWLLLALELRHVVYMGTGRFNYGRYSWLDCYHIQEACTVAYTSRHINTTWLIWQSRSG